MLGKLSIIAAVAAILMIPTALSAQVGGAINPGVRVGDAVNAGAAVRGAVGEVSLDRIWGLGARRVGQFTVYPSIVWPPQSRADDGAHCYGQTSLLVGSRSGAERRWIETARSTEPGSLVRRRYSACPVDSCRNV